MLEPNVVKATRSVPRRGRGSNPSDLSDHRDRDPSSGHPSNRLPNLLDLLYAIHS